MEEIQQQIMNAGKRAMDLITDYFEGGLETGPRVDKAFKFVPQAIKIMHMKQLKTQTDRSHAIRILPFLKDEATRQKYIALTQPQVGPLLEHKPKK